MIYTIDSISPISKNLHTSQVTIVLVTGFFDLLHAEHINFLKAAKKAGDILIVAVESDERARILKGEGRPIESQSIRCQKLSNLTLTDLRINGSTDSRHLVDYIISLDESFNNPAAFESLIAAVKPSYLAVSSHTAHQDKKAALVEKYGGSLKIVHTHNPDISTSKLINVINTKKQSIIQR